jgi:hypothetical protein
VLFEQQYFNSLQLGREGPEHDCSQSAMLYRVLALVVGQGWTWAMHDTWRTWLCEGFCKLGASCFRKDGRGWPV